MTALGAMVATADPYYLLSAGYIAGVVVSFASMSAVRMLRQRERYA